jgi:hypothetical protein
MALSPEELPRSESQSVVTIHSPDGRAFLWLGAESPVMSWKVGDAVDFRDGSWVVLDRSEEGDSLSLTLGVAA